MVNCAQGFQTGGAMERGINQSGLSVKKTGGGLLCLRGRKMNEIKGDGWLSSLFSNRDFFDFKKFLSND